MKKSDYVISVGLVVFGIGIFLFSLYTASLVGLRRQLGLVGGDLSQSVDVNRLYRGLVEVGTLPTCDYWKSIVPVARYIFASPLEKLQLGRELSSGRVNCAISYLLSGNTERGVYTMLKAMRYDFSGAQILNELIRDNPKQCGLLQSNSAYGMVEVYLDSTEGSVRGIIEREYSEIIRLNRQNAEVCSMQDFELDTVD
ncbi:MAG: hypothetical protein Fur0011_2470 [Candidatus Microgenomates bacterium]